MAAAISPMSSQWIVAARLRNGSCLFDFSGQQLARLLMIG
jgi:hypothetical protein